ncbi:hypothetical protein GCM10010517_54870 [Streptosporangium fragile]|uniref:HTH tetR-type domain-containing protein n=1 Tax=Streptosporangium fragile TaxID=46186 RepID=A0ABP6IJM1_9ACTN
MALSGISTLPVITKSTAKVIARVGHAGMTTNAVAERAGMSPGSPYRFSRDKEEIPDGPVARLTEGRAPGGAGGGRRAEGAARRLPDPRPVKRRASGPEAVLAGRPPPTIIPTLQIGIIRLLSTAPPPHA